MQLEWRVPRYLDETPRLLFMDAHQALVMLLIFGTGLTLGFLFSGLVLGLAAAWLINRLKKGRHHRFLLHLAYWYMPSWIVSFACTPSAHNRLYLG